MKLSPLTAAALAHPSLSHGFFTRQGGASNGIYASLNAGFTSGDTLAAVLENRNRVAKFLGLSGGERLVTGDQVHRTEVVLVTRPWAADSAPQADGLVSRARGLALGILTADCAPVLFADADAGVLGACHAGWRGALGGIIAATVSAMTKLGAKRSRIAAAIGPCIGARSYEVSDAFVATFLDADPENMDFFEPAAKDGRALFDLGSYLLRHLEKQRLGAIEHLEVDTLTDPDRFYSYRRETLERGRPPEAYGRLISAIALPG